MADMRLSDWITIFLTGGTILLCLFGCVLLIAAWPHIVSIVSRASGAMRAEGAARRAYRQRVYDMSSPAQNAPVPFGTAVSVPGHGTGDTQINIMVLASNLTEAQYIELGARLVDRRGKYVFSGKTLYKIAGGNHDEFLASMRRWRGVEDEDTPHVTPIVGRRTSAVFETDPDYPYQAPA